MNLKTIAQAAGVSTATVSNVINGNHHKVSKATLEKVQKIIEELEYQPNALARSLASKRSRIVGVVVSNIGEAEHFYANPHYAHLLGLLEKYIREQGYYMMLRCVTRCEDSLELLRSWNVDGVIYFGTFPEDIGVIKRNVSIPVVFLDAYCLDQEYVNVGVDDRKGGYLAGKYLLDKGHRTIALAGVGFQYYGVMGHRSEGFWNACAEYGIAPRNEWVFEASVTYEQGVALGRSIARSEHPFTAVAAMADIMAIGIMDGLHSEGKRVPEDVSVIGFDDLLECRYTNPKLTSISQNTEEKARKAGECLLQMIREGTQTAPNHRNEVEVMERQSVRDLHKDRR